MIPFFFFFTQIVLIYFLSQSVTKELFTCLYRVIHSKRIALYLISLMYLPGTVIHEVSHFVAAAGLFLNVRSLNVIPQIHDDRVTLGTVDYVKADPIRGFLVGIAPFFTGLLIFFFLSRLEIDFSRPFLLLGILYIIFVMSSTMFSSSRDLQDGIYALPVLILIAILVYIFRIDLYSNPITAYLLPTIVAFFEKINYYIFVSVLLNVGILGFLKIINKR